MDEFESLHGELRSRKIEKREKRGYVQGPIMWQSHKKQKFNCTSCKRAFPRMEVLLQHLRDSSKHSQQPISREASLQMSNWLLAKDQRLHCCPTCCLGFQTETELYVHLKHTEVHKGSSEAQQADSLLLPKDEARLLRRDLQVSPSSLQQSPTKSQQLPSKLHCSPLKPAPDRQSCVRLAAKHVQQPQAQGSAICQPSTATAADDFRHDSNNAGEQDIADTTHSCSLHPLHADLGLPQCIAAERPLSESAPAQDSHGLNPNTSESGPSQGQKRRGSAAAAASRSELHADSLKSLQRRVVARKRKRGSDGAAKVAEDSDSAASCSEVATMTFIEPHINKPAMSADGPQAKKQHQRESSNVAIGQQ